MLKYRSILRLEEYHGELTVTSNYVSPTVLLFIRSIIFFYMIIVHVINIIYNYQQPLSFVMYLSNLIYYGLTVYMGISFYVSLRYHLSRQSYIPYENTHWTLKFGYLWLYGTCFTLTTLIFLIYWSLLASEALGPNSLPIDYFLAISFHGISFLTMILEVLLSCNPIFFNYLPFVLMTLLIYLPYALLFHLRYNIWVYFFLNYIENPSLFAGVVCGSLILCIVIFSIFVAIHHTRDCFGRRKTKNMDVITQL
ncbi:hypothetical protein K502DRAFT_367468 [Neoconidiobolus thromboides FSU 785]|nr:hypothetical protein K502DRAFT_367468 [Neoconidiobolus thromboides FSU 785]